MVTDAYGRSLDRTRLLDTSEANLQSILGASNSVLHEALENALERGIAKNLSLYLSSDQISQLGRAA